MYVIADEIDVGVPVIRPVVVLKFNPPGNAGEIAHVLVPYPPYDCTGCVADIS